jgi:hypothetical protein
MKHTALTLLILYLNSLLDSGKYDDISLEDVKRHIDDGSILRFLRQRAGTDIDLSAHLDSSIHGNFEEFYVNNLQATLDAYGGNERRKWGVEKKGLCLLLAWTNEIIQQGSGWQAEQDISRRAEPGNAADSAAGGV